MIITTEQLIDNVKDDYEKGDFVVFIGAGISRLMGCMGWDDLARSLIGSAFTPIEREQILGTVRSSKELITIAYKQFEQNKKLKEFYRIFGKALKPDKKPKDIYDVIKELHCKFITTNCDGLLEKVLTKSNYSIECTKEKFENSEPPHVFYLHGRYVKKDKSDKNSLVFTVDRYLERYSDPKYLEFLKTIFQKNTVLFLGYGLNEFELLDHLFTKTGQEKNSLKKHYVIEGFYSHLPVLRDAKASYYNALGINLLPYDMDAEGHFGQVSVIKELVSKISEKTSRNASVYETIIRLMDSYSHDKFSQLMIYLGSNGGNNPFIDEFFNMIVKRPDYLQWLSACHTHGLFAAKKCPQIEFIKDGAYRSVRWPALRVLNRCLQENNSDTELVELAASIVTPIICYISGKKPLTDNLDVTNDLLDIVLNLSDYHITPDVITFIKSVDLEWTHFDRVTFANSNFLCWSKQNLYEVLHHFLGYHIDTKIYRRVTGNLHQYQLEFILDNNDFTSEQTEVLFNVAFALLLSLKDEYELRHIRLIENIVEHKYDDYYRILIALVIKHFQTKENKDEIITQLLYNPCDTFLINLGFYIIRTQNLDMNLFFNMQFNPLDNTGIFTELYALIEYFKCKMSNEEVERILTWVKQCNMDVRENWEYRETFINTRKATVCYLLSEISDDAKALYEEYKEKDIWDVQSPVEEAKLYDLGGHITIKPMFTSDAIPTDIDEAITFLNKKYDENNFFAPESGFELLKYLEERFKQDNHIVTSIVPKLSDALAAMIVGLLRQTKNDSPEWISSMFCVYEEIVDIQLCKRESPDEELIKNVIHALNYGERSNLPTERIFALVKKLIEQRARFDGIKKPLAFPNYWNNIYIQMYDFYINCLVKNASEITDSKSRISDENKADFIALLRDNENKSFKYVVSEHVDQVVYLDGALIFDNLDNLFKVDNIINLEACLSVMNKCRYVYSDITQFFVKNNVFNGLLKSLILNNEDVIRYGYHKGLCRYLIAGYSFEQCDFSVVKDFIDICPDSYYATLVSETTSKKTSNAEIQYEKIFSNIFDTVSIKASGNSKILHDVCSRAFSIYRVVDKPSDSLFERIEFCIEHMDENKMYWNQLISLYKAYQTEYLDKMIGCIMKFLRNTRSIYFDDVKKIIDRLVAINRKNVAIEICNICIGKRMCVNEFAAMLRELFQVD